MANVSKEEEVKRDITDILDTCGKGTMRITEIVKANPEYSHKTVRKYVFALVSEGTIKKDEKGNYSKV